MIVVRGGSGLGDSLFVYPIARHFLRKGNSVKVLSDWGEVFSQLGVSVGPFSRQGATRIAHYSLRRGFPTSNQFQDCCFSSKLRPEDVEYKMDWVPKRKILPVGRPNILVQMPREPFNRGDNFGIDLLPDCSRIQKIIDLLKDRFSFILVGSGKPLYEFSGLMIDLSNKTSVSDLIDLASTADGFIGYPSFMVPLSELFDKPSLFVWSKKGLTSGKLVLRQITPRKVLSKNSSSFVIDDVDPTGAANAFYNKVRSIKSI